MAIVKNGGQKPKIILVSQFRPPTGRYTIEFPAGLVDPSETPSQTAIRELKEETGYSGVVSSASPTLTVSPGILGETMQYIKVEVDLALEMNQNVATSLEDGEFVETRLMACWDT